MITMFNKKDVPWREKVIIEKDFNPVVTLQSEYNLHGYAYNMRCTVCKGYCTL